MKWKRRSVRHFYVVSTAPNESDTEGNGYLLCGLDTAMRYTTSIGVVTCKKCLKRYHKTVSRPQTSISPTEPQA